MLKRTIKSIAAHGKTSYTLITLLFASVLAVSIQCTLLLINWASEYGAIIQEFLNLTDNSTVLLSFVITVATVPGQIRALTYWLSETFQKENQARALAVMILASNLAIIPFSLEYAQACIIFAPISVIMAYFTFVIQETE